MSKILQILILAFICQFSSAQGFFTNVNYKGAFPVTDGTSATDWTYSWSNFDPENTSYPATTTVISSDITSNTTISGTVLLQNKVYVTNNANLTILPGTIIRGDYSTKGTLIITKGSQIIVQEPNVWEQGRHLLDFQVGKKFKNWDLKLNVRDALAQKLILFQDLNGNRNFDEGKDNMWQSSTFGQNISLSAKYSF